MARSVAVGAHYISSTFRDFVTPTTLVLGLMATVALGITGCSSPPRATGSLTTVANAKPKPKILEGDRSLLLPADYRELRAAGTKWLRQQTARWLGGGWFVDESVMQTHLTAQTLVVRRGRKLTGLSVKDGSELWSTLLPFVVIADAHDAQQFIVLGSRNLEAYDTGNGLRRWETNDTEFTKLRDVRCISCNRPTCDYLVNGYVYDADEPNALKRGKFALLGVSGDSGAVLWRFYCVKECRIKDAHHNGLTVIDREKLLRIDPSTGNVQVKLALPSPDRVVNGNIGLRTKAVEPYTELWAEDLDGESRELWRRTYYRLGGHVVEIGHDIIIYADDALRRLDARTAQQRWQIEVDPRLQVSIARLWRGEMLDKRRLFVVIRLEGWTVEGPEPFAYLGVVIDVEQGRALHRFLVPSEATRVYSVAGSLILGAPQWLMRIDLTGATYPASHTGQNSGLPYRDALSLALPHLDKHARCEVGVSARSDLFPYETRGANAWLDVIWEYATKTDKELLVSKVKESIEVWRHEKDSHKLIMGLRTAGRHLPHELTFAVRDIAVELARGWQPMDTSANSERVRLFGLAYFVLESSVSEPSVLEAVHHAAGWPTVDITNSCSSAADDRSAASLALTRHLFFETTELHVPQGFDSCALARLRERYHTVQVPDLQRERKDWQLPGFAKRGDPHWDDAPMQAFRVMTKHGTSITYIVRAIAGIWRVTDVLRYRPSPDSVIGYVDQNGQ